MNSRKLILFLMRTIIRKLAEPVQVSGWRVMIPHRLVVLSLQVCRDFFGHLTVGKLLRKVLRGDIALPIVRIETSQKAQRGVHLVDLASYIDKRRAAALKECHQLAGST